MERHNYKGRDSSKMNNYFEHEPLLMPGLILCPSMSVVRFHWCLSVTWIFFISLNSTVSLLPALALLHYFLTISSRRCSWLCSLTTSLNTTNSKLTWDSFLFSSDLNAELQHKPRSVIMWQSEVITTAANEEAGPECVQIYCSDTSCISNLTVMKYQYDKDHLLSVNSALICLFVQL